MQALFIRLLSEAAEGVLALVEHPPIVTALTAHGNSMTLHSYITGVAQPLTQVNFADLHVSIVLCLALALALPQQGWRGRLRLCGLALALNFLVLVVVCVVQVEVAAEGYASTHLALTLHTERERTILDWALRKSSFATVFLVPSLLFLTAQVSAWSGAKEPERPARPGWKTLAGATAVGLAAILLLASLRPDRRGVIDLDGLRKIAQLNPGSAAARVSLAYHLESAGRHDEALASYRRALELQPDLTAARFGEGNVLFSQGAYDAAAVSYQDVLRGRPDDQMARYNLGNVFMKQGRFDLARDAFETVLRSNPDDPAALRNLSQALIGLDRPCAAAAPLRRSMALDPNLATDQALREQAVALTSRCGAR